MKIVLQFLMLIAGGVIVIICIAAMNADPTSVSPGWILAGVGLFIGSTFLDP